MREELRRTLEDTRGNVVELIMKDNHTLGGNPRKRHPLGRDRARRNRPAVLSAPLIIHSNVPRLT